MPIYEYRCARCATPHEIMQKITDTPLKTCPSCGEDALEKQLTAAGFQLKGNGYYVTDFKNPPAPKCEPASCQSCPAANA